MNPNELRKKAAEAAAKAKAIMDAAEAKGTPLEASDNAKIDELLGQAESFKAEAAKIEADEEASRQRAERVAAANKPAIPSAKITPPTPGNGSIRVEEPNFTKDPMKGFASPREFFSMVMRENPRAAKDERMQFLSVCRLEGLAAAGSDEHKSADDSSLGFLVPEGMSPDLLTTPSAMNPLAGKLRQVPMDTPSIKVNYRVDKDRTTSVSGGLSVSRSAETAAKTASQMRIGRLRMEASSLFGFAYATQELLTDSPRSVAALIAAGFGEEFANVELNELLFGSGTGEPLGFLNANNAALISVSKETGQAAASIVANNIFKMTARCWNYNDAIWLYNPTCYPSLKTMYVPAGTAGVSVALWDTISTVVNGDIRTIDTFNGRPAYASDKMKAVGTKGDIALVVPSEILAGTYQPLQTAESIHVRFTNHEQAFKFWKRNDARPWWETALTPENGDTRSPFVTLNTRA